jgi:hypothetical protein
VAVVKVLADEAGVRVGALGRVAENLFRICNETPWIALERATLLVEPSEGRITVASEGLPIRANGTAIQIVCRPIVARLRAHLLPDGATEPQPILRFPPAVTGANLKTAGGENE